MVLSDTVPTGMRPYVIIYVTSSVDGKIASRSGYSKFSCEHDLKRLHSVRASVDAVLVGANTVIRDDPLLTVRYVDGRNPLRVVLDGRLKISENTKVVNDRSSNTLIFTSKDAPREKINALLNKGVEVILLEGKYGELNLNRVLTELVLRGVGKLLVEGGGETIWGFVKSRLFDELRLTISPYIVGGRDATSIVGGEGFGTDSEFVKLFLKSLTVCECGNELHIIYGRV
ncbi:MAG: 2,5-diamino-6-(ribosylamino)-4(3H)-pyrimidinone 5'-phosphate reductase [Sulfolobales archaeon]|nr:2,5-diamino-6-(ribosylamino)-4(3H)-pyrimidinone 5'-phosphate reductase [Sulfolobales archaeon]